MKHTPGPWRLTTGAYWLRIVGPAKEAIASFGNQRRWLDGVEVAANARRIVACVNACEGINPEAVPDLLEACRKLIEANSIHAHEIDEDILALAVDMAEAALAKAKEEA